MAIMVALSTFAREIRGRKVLLFSDNTGAELSVTKGSAKAWDHNKMIHSIWTQALEQKMRLWIERVPSKLNISDAPSRFRYDLLSELGAQWRKPVIANMHLV